MTNSVRFATNWRKSSTFAAHKSANVLRQAPSASMRWFGWSAPGIEQAAQRGRRSGRIALARRREPVDGAPLPAAMLEI